MPVEDPNNIPNNRENFDNIWELLQKEYPNAAPALNYSNPLELLVATILSAQCTDAQINMVTEKLFSKYKNVEDFAEADLQELEREIYSTGFYRNKAKNIKRSAQLIISEFGSQIPSTMEELLTLPGVARKTANIVLSRGFGINDGIAVDTHVKRLSIRLGLTKNTDPVKIEKDLMSLARKEEYDAVSMTLIWHGRKVCEARKPKCEICVVNHLCPSSRV